MKTLSIKNQKQRPGPSRSWWASHSLSPNGLRPWLPGTCVFGGPSSVGSTGAHGPRQSFGACGAGKGLPSATKWVWLPAPKPSVYSNGSHWSHGDPEAGGSAPALGSWNHWLVRQEREDSRLPLDTTHKNKSLHVRYPRRRIIPTTSQLCDFHVMENTLIWNITVHHSQTCDTGVTSRAQLKANCLGTRRTWGHFLAWFSRLRIQKCSDIFLGHGHGSDLALLSFDFL